MTSPKGLIVTLPSPFAVSSSFWKTPFPWWVKSKDEGCFLSTYFGNQPEWRKTSPRPLEGAEVGPQPGGGGPEETDTSKLGGGCWPGFLHLRPGAGAGVLGFASPGRPGRVGVNHALAPLPKRGVVQPSMLNPSPRRSVDKGPFPPLSGARPCGRLGGRDTPHPGYSRAVGAEPETCTASSWVSWSKALPFKFKWRSSS